MIRKIKDKVKYFLTRHSEIASDVLIKGVARKRLIEKKVLVMIGFKEFSNIEEC